MSNWQISYMVKGRFSCDTGRKKSPEKLGIETLSVTSGEQVRDIGQFGGCRTEGRQG